MKKTGRLINLFARNVCLACELGIPHKVKQNKWCKVKASTEGVRNE